MNAQEKLQRLLKVKAAFPPDKTDGLMNTLVTSLPFTREEHARAERGLASESRFADVFSALDWTALIHGLDQWQLPADSKEKWQVPDYLVFVRTPNREPSPVLIEAKLVSGQKETFVISCAILALLEHYAATSGIPLLIAIFWQKLHLWTTHTPDQLKRSAKQARLPFDDAVRSDMSIIFSDTLLLISTAWRRRTTYDPTPQEEFHLRDPKRGFIVADELAVDGTDFVALTEVESGIVNKILRPKVLNVEKSGSRSIVTTACTDDSVVKASSIVHLLLEQFETFGEEGESTRALNTLRRLKSQAHIPIQPLLPTITTAQVRMLFERTLGMAWSDDPT